MNPASREPAILWLGLIAPVVAALSAFLWHASPDTQMIVNAAAVAVAGAITAFVVKSDNLLPLITGAVQAVVATVAALGLDLDTNRQATVVVALSAIAAVLVRDRVTAPAPAVVVPQ